MLNIFDYMSIAHSAHDNIYLYGDTNQIGHVDMSRSGGWR